MRDVAQLVSERLLPRVKAPGQYIGLEMNARRKDVHSAGVTVALAFPDAYTIGISHLGSQVLYHMLNDTPGVACDRTYCPQADAEEVMRREHVPLFGWESRCAVRDFDILGWGRCAGLWWCGRGDFGWRGGGRLRGFLFRRFCLLGLGWGGFRFFLGWQASTGRQPYAESDQGQPQPDPACQPRPPQTMVPSACHVPVLRSVSNPGAL